MVHCASSMLEVLRWHLCVCRLQCWQQMVDSGAVASSLRRKWMLQRWLLTHPFKRVLSSEDLPHLLMGASG